MILVTGDTHGLHDIDKLDRATDYLKGEPQEANILIIAGDFGMIWRESYSPVQINTKDERTINFVYGKKPWITCWVDGNHENFDVINSLPITEKWGGRVHEITPFCYHLIRGEVYEIQGKKILALGGAYSVDKMYRKEGVSWWAAEEMTEEDVANARKNLEKHDFKVDYVVSHTCPMHMLNDFESYLEPWLYGYWGPKREDPTCKLLDDATEGVEYKAWYFGHYHMDLTHKREERTYRMLYQDVVDIGGTQ